MPGPFQSDPVQIMSRGSTLPTRPRSLLSAATSPQAQGRLLPIAAQQPLAPDNASNNILVASSTSPDPQASRKQDLDLPTWTPLAAATAKAEGSDEEEEADVLPGSGVRGFEEVGRQALSNRKKGMKGHALVGTSSGSGIGKVNGGQSILSATSNATSALISTLNAIGNAHAVPTRRLPPPPPPPRSLQSHSNSQSRARDASKSKPAPRPMASSSRHPSPSISIPSPSSSASSQPSNVTSPSVASESSSTSVPHATSYTVKSLHAKSVPSSHAVFDGVELPARPNSASKALSTLSSTSLRREERRDSVAVSTKRKRVESPGPPSGQDASARQSPSPRRTKMQARRTSSGTLASTGNSNLANLFSHMKRHEPVSGAVSPRSAQRGMFVPGTENDRVLGRAHGSTTRANDESSPDPLAIDPADTQNLVELSQPRPYASTSRPTSARWAAASPSQPTSLVDSQLKPLSESPNRVIKTYQRPKNTFFDSALVNYFESRPADLRAKPGRPLKRISHIEPSAPFIVKKVPSKGSGIRPRPSTDRAEADDLQLTARRDGPPSPPPEVDIPSTSEDTTSASRGSLASVLSAAFANNQAATATAVLEPVAARPHHGRPVRTLGVRRERAEQPRKERVREVLLTEEDMDDLLETQEIPLALDAGLPKWPRAQKAKVQEPGAREPADQTVKDQTVKDASAMVVDGATVDAAAKLEVSKEPEEDLVRWWDREEFQERVRMDVGKLVDRILRDASALPKRTAQSMEVITEHRLWPAVTTQLSGTQMWIERLEASFGPGNANRGIGRKPKRPKAKPATPNNGETEWPRKRQRIEDVPGDGVAEWADAAAVSEADAIAWAVALMKLVKGKQVQRADDMGALSRVLLAVEDARERVTGAVLQITLLGRTVRALSELEDIPLRDEHRMHGRAVTLVRFWKDRFGEGVLV